MKQTSRLTRLNDAYIAGRSCKMWCIGAGPGPKNVGVIFSDGEKSVVPYAIWKHKLSKLKETKLAERQFLATVGIVQQFPDKPVVTERELGDQDIREFTIKTITKQTLVRVTLGPEFADAVIVKGAQVGVDGAFTTSESKGKTYHNIWARELAVVLPIPKTGEGATSNPKTVDEEEAPF